MIRMGRIHYCHHCGRPRWWLAACCGGPPRTAPAAGHGGAGSRHGRPSPVSITPASRAAPSRNSVEVVGTLAPKFSADVKSEVTGTVTAVYVTEWVPVRKGDRLARLDTSETEAGIEALKAGRGPGARRPSRARSASTSARSS